MPLGSDEQPAGYQHTLGPYTQQVEVEVYESSGREDTVFECAPLSSIRSHELSRAENKLRSESSLKATDEADTVQNSLAVDLADGENQCVVTNDGE